MDFSSIASLTSYFTSVPVDWIIFGGCILFLAFDALRAGPARVTALSIALPVAYLLSSVLPQTAFIGNLVPQSSDAIVVGVFVLLALGLFVVFYRIVDSDLDSLGVAYALLSGAAAAAILMVILLRLPEDTWPWAVSPSFQALFGATYALYWMLVSYLVLAIVRR